MPGTLRRLHRWIGLAIALPVAIQGLTGALLALEPALPHGAAPPAALPQPASRVVSAAMAEAGAEARLLRYALPSEPGGPATVQVAQPGAAPADIRLDTATLVRLPPDATAGFWSSLRTLHVAFLVPEFGGRSIGGWFGIGLVLLLVTGIPIWWPRHHRWKAAVTIDHKSSGWRLQRSIHGAVGAWSVVVVLVLAFTGIVLAFPTTSRGMLGLEAGGPPRPNGRAATVVPNMDAGPTAATAAVSDARALQVIPGAAGQPVRVFMAIDGRDGALGRVVLQLDPDSLRVLSVQDARTARPADRAYRWMHDLHEGLGLGPTWRLLVVLAGVALPVFAITGPVMWWLVRRNRRQASSARVTSTQPT